MRRLASRALQGWQKCETWSWESWGVQGDKCPEGVPGNRPQRPASVLTGDCKFLAEGSALDSVGTGKPQDAGSWGASDAGKACFREVHLGTGCTVGREKVWMWGDPVGSEPSSTGGDITSRTPHCGG